MKRVEERYLIRGVRKFENVGSGPRKYPSPNPTFSGSLETIKERCY